MALAPPPASRPWEPAWVPAAIVVTVMPILYWIASGVYYAYFHPLARVPGPKLYAFSQLPFMYHLAKGDWHEVLKGFHERYGTAVRYTYYDVSFITTDAIKKIFGHKSAGERSFEKDMKFYRRREDASIIVGNNEEHRRIRRLLAHAFSDKALRNQEDILKYYVDLFINKLTAQANRGSVLDIAKWYNFATFDLIGDLAFGQPFGCLESGGYHPWVGMIFQSVKALPFQQIIARLGLDRFVGILTPSRLRRSFEEHKQLSEKTVMKRLDSQNTEREDFMSYILRHNDKNGMSKGEIVETSSTLIVAGSETTATLLSGTTFQLLANRDKYDKLTQEIRSEFQSEDEITLGRVNQLEYLLATFSEGMRMYPPVPGHLPRLCPPGGEFVDGYWLPENTSVSVPHWPAYRSTVNFRDPDMFVPERWMDDRRYINDNKSVLQPFSLGPRNCIGKNLAYAEMRLLLTRLLWKFDVELMPESRGWDEQKVFVLWEKGELNVKLVEVIRG